jgi:hypothetical protein
MSNQIYEEVLRVREKIRKSPGDIELDDLIFTNNLTIRGESSEDGKECYISKENLFAILEGDGVDITEFEKAYDFSRTHHAGQYRNDETAFYFHLDRIMLMLAVLGVENKTIDLMSVAALHDVVDNPPKIDGQPKKREDTLAEIKELNLGDEVYDAIEIMSDTKKTKKFMGKWDIRKDTVTKYFDSQSPNLVEWIVRVCDRLENHVGTENYFAPKRRMKLEESWTYYLPMAQALHPVLGSIMKKQLSKLSEFDSYKPELLTSFGQKGQVEIYAPSSYMALKSIVPGLCINESFSLPNYTKSSSPDHIIHLNRERAGAVSQVLYKSIIQNYEIPSTELLWDVVGGRDRSKINVQKRNIVFTHSSGTDALLKVMEQGIFANEGLRIGYQTKENAHAAYFLPKQNILLQIEHVCI